MTAGYCPVCSKAMFGGRCYAWACPAAAAARARDARTKDRRNAVRRPPPLPHSETARICNLCGEALSGRRTSWCSDACRDIAYAATSPTWLLQHLVAIHGRRCWECGEPTFLVVDHVRPLWSLTEHERQELRWWLPFNLQLLCEPCHKVKTRTEAAERAARRRGEKLSTAGTLW